MEVKIDESCRNPKNTDIYIDEELFQTVDKVLFKRRLKNIESGSDFKEAFLKLELKIAYEYSLTCLAQRDLTSYELMKRMKDRLLSERAIEYALGKISKYLDDEQLLKRIIDYEKNRGKGVMALLVKLKKRSDFDTSRLKLMIEEAFPFEDRVKQISQLIDKKGRPTNMKEKSKLYRFLLSRGFSTQEIMSALDLETTFD